MNHQGKNSAQQAIEYLQRIEHQIARTCEIVEAQQARMEARLRQIEQHASRQAKETGNA